MGQSFLGHKVDNTVAALAPLLNHINKQLEKDGCASLVNTIASAASSGVLEPLAPTLSTAAHWAKFASVASGLVAVTATLVGADAMNHFKKLAVEVSKSLKGLCEAAEVSANLQHEDKFPQWVYDFVCDEVSKATAGEDLDSINTRHLLGRIQHPKDSPPSQVVLDKGKRCRPQFFFVYHPGNDWHAPFNNMLREKPIPGLIGVTNNLNALGLFLNEFRSFIGPEAIINILLPSAHMYVFAEDIVVAKEIHPLNIIGQTHRLGNPYVYLSVQGIEEANLKDVGLIVKPNKLGAGKIVVIGASGLGAGVAGAIGGGVAAALLLTAGCAVGGPVFLAGAAADVIIGGGSMLGFLGGGVAAGAKTGIGMTENAKWKGTKKDKRLEEKKAKK